MDTNTIDIIHLCVLGFILFAFITPMTAYINLKYVIPIIYVIQMLPKEVLCYKFKEPEHLLILRDYFKDSLYNPISMQGIMILGMITSAMKTF